MSSRQTIVDFVLEQAAGAGPLRARKMFGEFGIYRGDKMIAVVCDDQLYLKPTQPGRALLGAPVEAAPYPNARPHFLIGEALWEDRELLAALFVATDEALPPPRPRSERKTTRREKKRK